MSVTNATTFELFPYGIWNVIKDELKAEGEKHLNYFPMGFETPYKMPLLLTQHPIWTISLWDLKRGLGNTTLLGEIDLNYFPMGFETRLSASTKRYWSFIWTISLWDLKPVIFSITILGIWFELFPYGIWNI